VIVTGYDLGMNTPGGFGRYIRVPSEWVVRLPKPLVERKHVLRNSRVYRCTLYPQAERTKHTPEHGQILVTGATGGVGCIAVSILSTSGFEVIAESGKKDQKQFLLDLGAKAVLDRKKQATLPESPC